MLEERVKFKPLTPSGLKKLSTLGFTSEGAATPVDSQISSLFPHIYEKGALNLASVECENRPLKVGVLFSGGQAPGGHNVVAGLFDALQEIDPKSQLWGFLGGPAGLIEGNYRVLDRQQIDEVRNSGGFDLLGSGRTKVESEEQLQQALKASKDLDGLIVIGGDDSNTNAAVMANYFLEHGSKCCVVGVPKTIDGDLQNEQIEISFGFDTATKCYAEMISNIERDAISAKKYYHFIKLMGRSASHIALECALKTHPNFTIIGEEVAAKGWTLENIVDQIVDMVQKRGEMDHHFGVVLVPEGLFEFIPEMRTLFDELNQLLANGESDPVSKLSAESLKAYQTIPQSVQNQLLLERDPHGNVQVSHIETEKVIAECVKAKVKGKFNPVTHFFGYEGRAAYPSNFDANYCYALGRLASLLVRDGKTGYMSVIRHLAKKPEEWVGMGIPIVSMMNMEVRKGVEKPVIKKALVDLDKAPFKRFASMREEWMYEPCYQYVGAIQYWGPTGITDSVPEILRNC